MAARTPRMAQLEELIALDPADDFLHYGLAMEHAGQGNDDEAARQLLAVTSRGRYVPAFLMAGQVLARLGRDAEAVAVLKAGIVAANSQGNTHAAGEMAGLLATLE